MIPLEFPFDSPLAGAALCAAAALIVYPVLRREARVRPHAWWTREEVVGIAFAPVITILLAFAAMLAALAAQGSAVQAATSQELTVVGGAVAVTALVWIVTSIGQGASAPAARARVTNTRAAASAAAAG